jgi:hypothetical protein
MNKRPTPLEFLEAVYCDENLPLTVRMRAAVECAPYVHPKLGVIAISSVNGASFGAMLDRAILRSQGNSRNVPQLELKAEPEPS